ncbi:unnamed protein product [Lasius platythorax]|uniref:Uncharacterized protein n=1 Tax=Lasius platythorax TaxID=488582 RepID=A0AAV2N5I9_9HYME
MPPRKIEKFAVRKAKWSKERSFQNSQLVITKYYQVLRRDRRIITSHFNAFGIMARLISELHELTKGSKGPSNPGRGQCHASILACSTI